MNINFFTEEVDFPSIIKKTEVRDLVKLISDQENVKFKNINYILSSDEYLHNINLQYLNHDYYTDIITFPYYDDKYTSSDIFISIDRVKENSQVNMVSFRTELLRVLIHGILHLCSYDDKNKNLKHLMTNRENFYLNLIHAT